MTGLNVVAQVSALLLSKARTRWVLSAPLGKAERALVNITWHEETLVFARRTIISIRQHQTSEEVSYFQDREKSYSHWDPDDQQQRTVQGHTQSIDKHRLKLTHRESDKLQSRGDIQGRKQRSIGITIRTHSSDQHTARLSMQCHIHMLCILRKPEMSISKNNFKS